MKKMSINPFPLTCSYLTGVGVLLVFFLFLYPLKAGFKNVTDYDEDTLKSVVKICDVAYGAGSSHRDELEEEGWVYKFRYK